MEGQVAWAFFITKVYDTVDKMIEISPLIDTPKPNQSIAVNFLPPENSLKDVYSRISSKLPQNIPTSPQQLTLSSLHVTARTAGGMPDQDNFRNSGRLVLGLSISSKNLSCLAASLSLPVYK